MALRPKLLERLLPSQFIAICITFKQKQAHIRTLRPQMPKKRKYTPAEHAGMAALAKYLPLRAVADEYQCAPSAVSYQLQKIAKSTAIDPESTAIKLCSTKSDLGAHGPTAFERSEQWSGQSSCTTRSNPKTFLSLSRPMSGTFACQPFEESCDRTAWNASRPFPSPS